MKWIVKIYKVCICCINDIFYEFVEILISDVTSRHVMPQNASLKCLHVGGAKKNRPAELVPWQKCKQ